MSQRKVTYHERCREETWLICKIHLEKLVHCNALELSRTHIPKYGDEFRSNKGPVEKQNNDFSLPKFAIFIGVSYFLGSNNDLNAANGLFPMESNVKYWQNQELNTDVTMKNQDMNIDKHYHTRGDKNMTNNLPRWVILKMFLLKDILIKFVYSVFQCVVGAYMALLEDLHLPTTQTQILMPGSASGQSLYQKAGGSSWPLPTWGWATMHPATTSTS